MLRCPACAAANAPVASTCHLCERPIARASAQRPEVVELSAIAEETARRGRSYGLVLDFSAASIASLDVWLEGVWPTDGVAREGPEFRPDREQVELVWSLGVYLGEVLVRLLAGHFREDRCRSASPPDVPVVFRGDVAAWPIMRARERLRVGVVKALYPYFRFVRTQVAGREDAPGDAAGWLAHAQAFTAQRQYLHALRFADRALAILPGSVPALLEKAAAEHALARDEDARVTFERLTETCEAVGARDWLQVARARLPALAAPRPSAPSPARPSAPPPRKGPPRPAPKRPTSSPPEVVATLEARAPVESAADAPEAMHPSLAAEEAATKLGFGGELALANLEVVDRWIESLGGLDDEASARVAFWVGAYVGEILVRRLGGAWAFDASGTAAPTSLEVAFDGVRVAPARWIAQALRGGPPLTARVERLRALLA